MPGGDGGSGRGVDSSDFKSELAPIMYAFGDKQQQLPETLELVNSLVVEFMEGMTRSAMAASFSGSLTEESLQFAVRNDKRKADRIKQLLAMFERIKTKREVGMSAEIKSEEELQKTTERRKAGSSSKAGGGGGGGGSGGQSGQLASKKRRAPGASTSSGAKQSKGNPAKRAKVAAPKPPVNKVSTSVNELLSAGPILKAAPSPSSRP